MRLKKEFRVWCLELDSTEDDARTMEGVDPELVAQAWAEHQDASSSDYWIVGGETATVIVKDGDTEYLYKVTGEPVAMYRAELVE